MDLTDMARRRRLRMPAAILASLLFVPVSGIRAQEASPGAAPAPKASSPSHPLERRTDDAIMRGLAFLAHTEPNPHLYIFLDMFRRRYALGLFQEARDRFDELMAMAPEESRRFVRSIRRLIDPGFPPKGESADVCLPTVDVLTCPALYCDRTPAPKDYVDRLKESLADGRYGVTHVALAAMVAEDMGCEGFVPGEIRAEAIEGMRKLIVLDGNATDLEFEAATFLTYLGHGADVPPGFKEEALDSQRATGAWALDPSEPQARDSWHASCTAVWYLLETHPTHKPQAPMVPRP